MSATDHVRLTDQVVVRDLVDETVLLSFDSGRYYRLDSTGGTMLQAVLAHGTIGGASGALADSGWGARAEVTEDLLTFCRQLEALHLVQVQG
jgi:hypothetical protein